MAYVHLMLILYTASHLPVFLHLSSSRRRKLNQKRADYVDRWLNGWIDGDYIEQEMKDVFCCWLNRSPLYICRGGKMKVRRERLAWKRYSHLSEVW